jgi:phosphodiesterase/alkaline phosphatase D-like protein
VVYGSSTAFTDSVDLADLEQNHNVTLTRLDPETVYHYAVHSSDFSGNTTSTRGWIDLTFRTRAARDTTAPVLRFGPLITSRSDVSATIMWFTDEVSTSAIYYSLDSSYAADRTDNRFVTDHSISLTNLRPDTTYHYRIASTDQSGNSFESIDIDYTFTTDSAADSEPPIITFGPAVKEVTTNSAYAEWKTHEPATSFVEFGTDSTYGQIVGSTELNLEHRVALTGLTAGTQYHYFVRSADGSRNTVSTDWIDITFRTLDQADDTPPNLIAGPYALNITSTGAVINWRTDELSSSQVEYGPAATYSDKVSSPLFAREHSIQLPYLEADSLYHYRVISSDAFANRDTSTDKTFRTAAGVDATAPTIITGPVVKDLTDVSAVVYWSTDEASTSEIYYGETTDYSDEAADLEYTWEHSIRLNGLEPNTAYHYQIASSDLAGNRVTSQLFDFSFRTRAEEDTEPPVVIAGPLVSSRTDRSAVIVWYTDESGDSKVEYGTSSNNLDKEFVDSEPTLAHQVTLTNLQPGTEYYYRVSSTDQKLNTGYSVADYYSFSTKAQADTEPPVILTGPIMVAATDQNAVIRWETDEQADSRVEYGSTPDYGFEIILTQYTFLHNITITNLEQGTNYYYRVTSADPSGNTVSWPEDTGGLSRALQPPGGAGSFTTSNEPDTRSPVIISGPSIVSRTNSTATIEWETDEVADSRAEYGSDSEYDLFYEDGTDVNVHRIILTNLNPGETYNYRVASIDPSNNPATASTDGVFTTELVADVIAPTLTEGPVVLHKTNDRATIQWKTNEPATSRVDFGLSTSYDDYRESAEYVNEHKATITNLKANTEYNFKVRSVDVAENKTESANVTFRTEAASDITPPNLIGKVSNGAVSDQTAEVIWKTDEISDSFIHYGIDPGNLDKQTGAEQDVIEHKLTLSGLSVGTIYYYSVGSTDPSGNVDDNLATGTLTTLQEPDTEAPAKPEKLLSLPRNQSVILKWIANTEADLGGYNIERAKWGSGSYASIITLVTDTTYTDLGLTNDSEYLYRIAAADKFGNVSVYSEATSATPAVKLPPDPFDLVSPEDGSSISNSTVTFVWDAAVDPNPGETVSYNIHYATSDDFADVVKVKGITDTTTSIALTTNQYFWRVVAIGSDNEFRFATQEAWSFSFTSSVELADFTAAASSKGAIIQWTTAREEGLRGFRLLRSGSESGDYTLISPTNKLISPNRSNYKYIDRTAETGNTYHYKLEAVIVDGGSTLFGPLTVDMVSVLPRTFAISQNYPNPFNPETLIDLALPAESRVILDVYNITGQLVRRLVSERKAAGYHKVSWDGKDNRGQSVPSGIYLYRISAVDINDPTKNFTRVKKMVLLK